MFVTSKCQCPGCATPALSVIKDNEIVQNPEKEGFPPYCIEHTPDKEAAALSIRQYIETHQKIIGLSACGMDITQIDFSDKEFYGCNFQHSKFNGIHSNGARLRMCILDFSTFTDCDMLNSNIQFCSFAGSRFVHMLFTGSDLVQSNFNGISAYQCSFDDSDFYASRFIKAMLMNTSMSNCNLKRAIFYDCTRERVSFRLSNTREAFLSRENTVNINEFEKESEGAL